MLPRSGKIVVGIQRKSPTKGHAFLNHDEIVEYLKRDDRFEVAEIRDGNSLTAKAEIELVANMDMYITPPGGGSFSSIFIRNGGTVIYGKGWTFLQKPITRFLPPF
jgi:hypothetical protein